MQCYVFEKNSKSKRKVQFHYSTLLTLTKGKEFLPTVVRHIIMRRTAIVPTLSETPPGLYRFFLVKGDSGGPYEYITYTDPFLVVKKLNECSDDNNNNNDNNNNKNGEELFGNIDPTNNAFNPEETAATNDDDLSGCVGE
jgi:hypothetical protein